MRIISLKNYDENTMKLATPILDRQRRTLLGAGQVIHPIYKNKLIDMGINMIIVEDEISKGITLEDMVEMPTWMDAIGGVQSIFESAKKQSILPITTIQKLANHLVSEVKFRKAIQLVPSNSIAKEIRMYGHSVNVALLSLQTAKKLSYHDSQLRDLAIGCLLYNIGVVKTDNKIEIPEAGFEILRKNRDLNLLSAHVAFQQEERYDGTGFPRKIKGDLFHDYAQICGVSKTYEDLLAQGIAPHLAMEKIMTLNGSAYSPKIIDAFIHSIPSYPPGTKVSLNTGDEGIVSKIDTHIHRPVVRLIQTQTEIRLAENPTILIKAVGD